MAQTRKNKGRGSATRGWKREKPGYHQKTVMLRKCGHKCFLGPRKSFPICKKNTCKVSSKGKKYRNISKNANNLLKKMGAKR